MQSISSSLAYFDSAASTRPFAESLDAFRSAEEEFFCNPSSTHSCGKLARRFVESCRQRIAEILNIDTSFYDIIFTANATDGNQIMLQSVLKHPSMGVLMGRAEHDSVERNAAILKAMGRPVRFLRAAKGFSQPDEAEKDAGSPGVGLVSVMQTNNITGAISDIYSIAEAVKDVKSSIIFHSDCVQSLNLGLIDFRKAQKSGIDALTFSSHKSYAPKGLGLLVIRKGLTPSLSPGGGQEKGVRPGTESVGLIAAYTKSLEMLFSHQSEYKSAISALSGELLRFLDKSPHCRALREVGKSYSDSIVAIAHDSYPSQALQRILSDNGVMVSTTSACSGNTAKGSVNKLLAMGYSFRVASNTIRVSFSAQNTRLDLDRLITALDDAK